MSKSRHVTCDKVQFLESCFGTQRDDSPVGTAGEGYRPNSWYAERRQVLLIQSFEPTG